MKFAFFFCALFVLMFQLTLAQEQGLPAVTAKFDKDFVLTLSGTVGLNGEYTASLEEHNFTNFEAAKTYWNYLRDNLVHFALIQKDKTLYVVIYPHTQYVRGWLLTDWNAYFEQNKTKYSSAFKDFK